MSVVVAGAVGAAGSIASGIIGGGAARRAARRARRKARKLEKKLAQLEANRQEIINPYEGVTSLSAMLSNPFEKLTVATKATEIQMEQTDIALANTLDTLRATGASAGGATALAQAALQSKKGIAADIERQEANNNQQRLSGEQRLQSQQMAHRLLMFVLFAVVSPFLNGCGLGVCLCLPSLFVVGSVVAHVCRFCFC